MGLDFSLLVKLPQMDMFARPIAVNGVASRGIWHRDNDDFLGEDNSIVTDHKVSIDVLDSEFAIVPRQGDRIEVPADGSVPAEGTFTVLSAHGDGGGMTNLVLSEYTTTVPAPSDVAWIEPGPRIRQRGKL